jgi:hypothetical protein
MRPENRQWFTNWHDIFSLTVSYLTIYENANWHRDDGKQYQ